VYNKDRGEQAGIVFIVSYISTLPPTVNETSSAVRADAALDRAYPVSDTTLARPFPARAPQPRRKNTTTALRAD
jgi:hypothetical protein